MTFFRRFRYRLYNFLWPERAEQDLAREVDLHLGLLQEEFQGRGMSLEEARLEAKRAYGGVEQAKELHREERSWLWLEQVRQDIRYAIRGLLKSPGFSSTAILTLALGIGATAAIFSVADVVLLRSLPYPRSSQLVIVRDELSKMGVHYNDVSYETFEAYRKCWCFDARAAFTQGERTLISAGSADRVVVLSSTEGLPEMLGAHTILGRGFGKDDWNPEHNRVAILSHALFARRFGASSSAIGQTLRVDDRIYTVIGVMGPEMKLGFSGKGADLWIPLPTLRDPLVWQFQMLARIRAGVTFSQAQTAIAAAVKQVEATIHPYRGPNGEDGGYTARVLGLRDQVFGDLRSGSLLLSCASALLLIIACVNVVNLLLARAASCEKETAMRRALGASFSRLLRQWMTEAAVLAAIGGALGVALAYWGVQLLKMLSPSQLPMIDGVAVDSRVLLFTLLASVLVCLFLSLAPAFATPAGSLSARGPRRRRRVANWLITTESAIAVVLLIGCGLLGKSLARLQQINPGIRVDHVLTMQIQTSGTRYKEPGQRGEFFSELENRLARLPGVISASEVDRLPVFTVGVDTRFGNPFSLDGRPWNPSAQTRQMAHTTTVGLNYFQTMGIGLIKGRVFSTSDVASAPPVAIINRTLERMFFPNGNAIGQHILFGAPSPGNLWMTIIGVVSDVRNGALDLPPAPQFFMPQMQDANDRMVVVLRVEGNPRALTRAALNVVRGLDPEQPVSDVITMEEHVDETLGQPRFRTALTSLFGLMALVLAAIGIYGVVSNGVVQRTKEIGIRSALGADAERIVATVLADGMRPVGVGVVMGVLGGAMLARLLASILYEVKADDSLTLAGSIVLIGFISAAACLLPAVRASRIDPVITLREE